MAIPVISTNPVYRTAASGVPFSLTFSASGSPTSWGVSGGPAGWTIADDTGILSGTATISQPTAYTISVTATNGDGTSDAVVWLLVLIPAAVGGTQDETSVEIDYDLITGQLSIPGIGGPVPEADGVSSVAVGDAEGYLALPLTAEERFPLAIGVSKRGVLQDVDIAAVEVTLKEFATDRKIALNDGSVAEIGTDSTRRFATTIFVDPTLVEASLAGNAGLERDSFAGTMQLRLTKRNDDAGFVSSLSTETIATLDQGDTHNDTHAITIASEVAALRKYLVTARLLTPSDPALQVTLTREISLTFGGGTYTLNVGGGVSSGTGSSTVEADWDTTLSIQQITATATGVSVDTRVVTTAQVSPENRLVLDMRLMTVDGGVLDADLDAETWEIRDSGDEAIFTWSPAIGDGAADIAADFLAGSGETVTVEMDNDNDIVRILLPSGSAMLTAVSNQSNPTVTAGPEPLGPEYEDASVTVQVTGVSMPELNETRISHSAKVLVYREH